MSSNSSIGSINAGSSNIDEFNDDFALLPYHQYVNESRIKLRETVQSISTTILHVMSETLEDKATIKSATTAESVTQGEQMLVFACDDYQKFCEDFDVFVKKDFVVMQSQINTRTSSLKDEVIKLRVLRDKLLPTDDTAIAQHTAYDIAIAQKKKERAMIVTDIVTMHINETGKFVYAISQQLSKRFKKIEKLPQKCSEESQIPECANCNTQMSFFKTLQKCSRCKLVYYCDRTCQTKDWKKHKIVCIPSERKK